LDLLSIVFKNYTDELNDSNDEATESNGTQMIDKDPFHCYHDCSFSFSLTCVREVPGCTGSCNNELKAANKEGIHPKTAKQMIKENITSLLAPNDCCSKL
jgi:hypothetical protein